LSALAIAASNGVGTYLFPALTIIFLAPVLLRVAPKRGVYSGIALAVIAWTLVANTVRPHVLDAGGGAPFIIIGVLLTFAAVLLISQNQEIVTAPLRPIIDRPSQAGLSTRLAVAYPLGRRFRTGAILIMYGLVIFTLVFVTILASLIGGTVDRQVASASGGYGLRVDFNPAAPIPNPARTLATGPMLGKVSTVTPLSTARVTVSDISPMVTGPTDAVVVSMDPSIMQEGGFPLAKRASAFPTDQAAWNALFADPRYTIVDNFLGQLNKGGPPGDFLRAGDVLTLTDPLTGKVEHKTIAGTLDSAFAFYGLGGGLYSPVIISREAAISQFGSALQPTAALVQPTRGESVHALAVLLQGQFLRQGLSAVRIRQAVEQNFAANNGFFQLMQGFVALGLLVGVAGLGVVMVRAVRERRRSIGVLRALGFPSRTVERAFLKESLFVTLEGVVIGTALSIVTTYLLFKNDELFQSSAGFSIPWVSIIVLAVAAIVASVLATLWPARQASKVKPAVALRMGE
jgi:putative ABC transport system permease protein